MEGLAVNPGFWRGKRVLVTGHTGFKGGWLARWLLDMGAEVHGYALPPPTEPNFFFSCNLSAELCSQTLADIRDLSVLAESMQAVKPEIVLHLAAQALVRHSYAAPIETYAVNIMGTANLLEAVRKTPSVRVVVNVTSDKCYENREWLWPYREGESLGGCDPYSSSKACSEILTAAYRHSFLDASGVKVASARAGNVIGGGDWAKDRLIPDFFRAIDSGQTISIRSPHAVRPWQHVLEPLSGYMLLAERLWTGEPTFCDAWNFGPAESDGMTVQEIVTRMCNAVPGAQWVRDSAPHQHEANLLKLDSSKARKILGWQSRWDVQTSLQKTFEWHAAWKRKEPMSVISSRQIAEYTDALPPALI